MAMTIHVDIVSAEAEVFSGPATMVFAPAKMGEVGIAPRHAPMLAHLAPGEVRVQTQEDGEEVFYVSGGMLEVQPHMVTVLSDTALRAHDINETAALAAKKAAEKALADSKSDFDFAKAKTQLAEAAAQIHAAKKLRQQKRR